MAIITALLCISSCETDSSVSGTMLYAKSYGLVNKTEHFVPGSPCANFAAEVQNRVSELAKEYAETWEVPYSGTTLNSALEQADQEAFMGFEAAYYKLYKLGEEVKEQIATSYLGSGSFSYDYAAIVTRNIVIYQSYNVNFAYDASKNFGTISVAIGDGERGMGTVRIPEDVVDGKVVRTVKVSTESMPVSSLKHALYGPDYQLWDAYDGLIQFASGELREDGTIQMTLNLSNDALQQIAGHTGTWYYVITGRSSESLRVSVEVPFTLTTNENE